MSSEVAHNSLAPTKAPLKMAANAAAVDAARRQKVIYKSMLHINEKELAVLVLFDRSIDTYQ